MVDIIPFIETLNNITGAASSHRLASYVTPDIRFASPTYETSGKDGLRFAIGNIFAASDPKQGGRIRITDWAKGQDYVSYYLRWDRLIYLEGGKRAAYSGVTHIMFAPDNSKTAGLIASITDYYDPSDAPAGPKLSLFARLFAR